MDFLATVQQLLVALWTFVTTNPAGVGAAVGAVTPVLVSVLSRPEWTKRQRTVLTVGVSVVLGAAVTLSNSKIEGPADYLMVMLALYTACETFYQKFYKLTGLATVIEAATSPSPKPAPEPVVEEVPAGVDDYDDAEGDASNPHVEDPART
jgi:hypothetical protein